jgi:LacI family transcriptional regulator
MNRQFANQGVPRVILEIESSRASGRSLLRGVADYARHHGPWSFYWEPGGLEKTWPRLKSLDAHGIILRDVDHLSEVIARGLPAVVVGHSRLEVRGLANVITDSATIGKVAAEHLLHVQLGHFAYCGFDDKPWSHLRGQSFSLRLREAGFATLFYRLPRFHVPISWQSERLYMAEWLKSLPKPIGIMSCNDDRGQNVIEACKVAGLRVPDEVAIIGADNDELVCELADPPLSSVAINFERAGYQSARVLDQLMQGQPVDHKTIFASALHVVARQSTNLLLISDPHLAKALRFIHEHARAAVGVADVAAASGLSRRVLEKRFRSSLSRSILSEVRRVRTEQICRLLVETGQPISQIALALGFDNVEHIARYFRHEKKTTPLAYRKQYGHP